MSADKKTHWETVYATKTPDQVSWTQETPEISLELIESLQVKKNAKIIDVGGGDSKLVDCLLDRGYTNITVLDISKKALERAQARLGVRAKLVNWIVSDITNFNPDTTFEVWHDRAAFHFLTEPDDINKYISLTNHFVSGYLVLGTFSTQGPEKCSGLNISQYSESSLSTTFKASFEPITCKTEDHNTPFSTTQNFVFCSFKKK
ncbi:class I SAM-dependent methyltransferase [Bizionia paragorgiae]|jgi:trans-aconitate methyltransferase|uniref:Methyltransferase domain-containing protein n=1 Tax=Bizionia paragorgiae TaxID=283786 RepID=A0A1H4CRP9_BIZPA|nr:class I SAM-dependent methyltransferase [Bizionia paragorgiae]MDX1270405.1 class I SAM-dependent methyltransferase [Bizionia paragorgiae]SEA63047.1 Methyltransferase domain-containing protein [Bizionia paragorgiae]